MNPYHLPYLFLLLACTIVILAIAIFIYRRTEKDENITTPQYRLDEAKHAWVMAAQDVRKEMLQLHSRAVTQFTEEFAKHCKQGTGEIPEARLEKYLPKYRMTIKAVYFTLFPELPMEPTREALDEHFDDACSAPTISEVHISSFELPFLLEVKRFNDSVSAGLFQLMIDHPDYSPLDQP